MKKIYLLPGKDRALRRRHPWLFAGAIDAEKIKFNERLGLGETVRIHSDEGEPLAVGAFSPHSQIRVRIWSFDENAIIDHRFFKNAVLFFKYYCNSILDCC